jgi:hypothetical protein
VRSPSSESPRRSNSRLETARLRTGVAEELEPLVVVGAEAAVGQGPLQEAGVGEAVADALLKNDEAGIHA